MNCMFLMPTDVFCRGHTRLTHDMSLQYYYRECDETDMSTTSAADLFLPDNATPEEAYQHNLRHGFTLFPRVLTEETAAGLRKHILARNHNLTAEDNICVCTVNTFFCDFLSVAGTFVSSPFSSRNKRIVCPFHLEQRNRMWQRHSWRWRPTNFSNKQWPKF